MPDISFQKPAGELSEEEATAKLQVQSEQAQMDQASTLSQAAQPATEPLDPARVNSLGETLQRAIDQLGGGQMGDLGMEQVDEPVEQIPPKIFAGAAALSAVLSEMGMDQHAFDPVELTTSNKGVAELAATVDQIASDPAVAKAMQGPAPSPAPEAPPDQVAAAEPAGDDLDRFVQ